MPLEGKVNLAEIAGLPWGSITSIHACRDKLDRIVGPAIWQKDQWALPVFPTNAEGLAESEREAAKVRRSLGLEPASV